jgi:hypothetical protein
MGGCVSAVATTQEPSGCYMAEIMQLFGVAELMVGQLLRCHSILNTKAINFTAVTKARS